MLKIHPILIAIVGIGIAALGCRRKRSIADIAGTYSLDLAASSGAVEGYARTRPNPDWPLVIESNGSGSFSGLTGTWTLNGQSLEFRTSPSANGLAAMFNDRSDPDGGNRVAFKMEGNKIQLKATGDRFRLHRFIWKRK